MTNQNVPPYVLPRIPKEGSLIVPLLTADQIFLAEQAVIRDAGAEEKLCISHYSLPALNDPPTTGTPASTSQRAFLDDIRDQVEKKNVKTYILTDNSLESDGKNRRNENTLGYLHHLGAYILPYPADFVLINHSKFVGNDRYAVVSSCNYSSHSADSPDDNTGFLIAGQAAKDGLKRVFAPQWEFSKREDRRQWSKAYPLLSINQAAVPDPKISWLNTAPKEERLLDIDTTEIRQAYEMLIQKAAFGNRSGYLYFEHFDISNLPLVWGLRYAKHVNPNLDVRIIQDPNQYLEGLENGDHDVRAVAYQALQEIGIPIRFANVSPHPHGSDDPQRFHDKYAVANDFDVINGSANFSGNSLNGNRPEIGKETISKKPRLHNREVDVWVRDENVAKQFRDKFLVDWAYGSSNDPKVAAGIAKPNVEPRLLIPTGVA